MFVFGFARGMRAEYHDKLYSTRVCYSLVNSLYYGTCIIKPILCLLDRIQIQYQGLDPEKHKDAYKEFAGVNRNVIL
jgi:hypothetical protein